MHHHKMNVDQQERQSQTMSGQYLEMDYPRRDDGFEDVQVNN